MNEARYSRYKTHDEYATDIDVLLPREEISGVCRIVVAVPVDDTQLSFLATSEGAGCV